MSEGINLSFGISPVLPLKGFPAGKARVRQRSDEFPVVIIRTSEGSTRRFYIESKDGYWYPALECGSNLTVTNEEFDNRSFQALREDNKMLCHLVDELRLKIQELEMERL